MQHREMYPPSQDFVHLSRRLNPGERVPACPTLVEQLLAASAAAARLEVHGEPTVTPAPEAADADDWEN
jgi:hypothetical protein